MWKKKNKKKIQYNAEFDDGSDWMLAKSLTHANHTLFIIIYGIRWCKGEYNIIWYNYLKVREYKSLIKYGKYKLQY